MDYLTLDIEGAELQVLRTIPFDKVDIRLLDIEMNHIGEGFDGTEQDISDLLKENGYRYYQKVSIDEIYVKEDLYKELIEMEDREHDFLEKIE